MTIWAIADLHLSFAYPDRRERFAERWRDHAVKLEREWRAAVRPDLQRRSGILESVVNSSVASFLLLLQRGPHGLQCPEQVRFHRSFFHPGDSRDFQQFQVLPESQQKYGSLFPG